MSNVSLTSLDSFDEIKASPAEVIDKLKTVAASGLSADEVKTRLDIYGRNEMEEGDEETLFQKFLNQFKEPLIIMLLCSALISAFMRQYDDALSICAAVLIVSTVAFIQEYRSEKSLEALNKLVVDHCVPKITNEVIAYMNYRRDVSQLAVPMSHPKSTDYNNTSLEFKTFF